MSEAEELFEKGKQLYQSGKAEKALEVCERIISIDRGYAAAWHGKGVILLGLGRYKDSLNAFENAIRFDNSNVNPIYGKAISLIKLRNYDKAISALEKLLELDSKNVLAYFELHKIYEKMGDFEKSNSYYISAIVNSYGGMERKISDNTYPVFTKTLTSHDTNYDYYLLKKNKSTSNKDYTQMGLNFLNEGDFQKALEYFNLTIDNGIENVECYSGKGTALYKLGRSKEAFDTFELAISLNPENAKLFYRKGNALLDLGRYEEAVQAYNRVIALAPKDANPWNDKGNVLSELNRYEEALQAYNRAIALNPKVAYPWYGKGNALSDLGRYEEALQTYNRAIAFDPKFAHPWHGKGNVLSDLDRYEEALQAYDRAIALDPKFADPWHVKGNILSNLGRYEEALQAYNHAIALDPKYANPWHGKGNALTELDHYEEAIQTFEQAIYLDPKKTVSWNGKGNALIELRQYEEALKAFEQAIYLDPKKAISWNGKGIVFAKLERYEEALQAFEHAIALNQQYASPWYGKGNIYFKLSQGLSINCYQRFIYLAKEREIKKVVDTLLPRLKESELPLLIERVLKQLPQESELLLLQSHWLYVQHALKHWNWIQEFRSSSGKNQNWESLLIDSIGSHYLGDSIEAFSIGDNVLGEGLHQSLLMQYYFGQAASAFFEQKGQVWSYAEKEALKFEHQEYSKEEKIEGYYAGMILLAKDKLKEAKDILEKQQDHLPSLYALAAVAKAQNEDLKPYAENILQKETELTLEDQLINGFIPRPWNIQEGNYLEQLQQYCYVRELAEIITEIRDYAEDSEKYQYLITEYNSQPFHNSFYIDAPGEKYIWDTIKVELAKSARQKLIQAIKENLEQQRSEIDEVHLDEVLQKSRIKSDFEILKQKARKSGPEKFDEEVGTFIENHPDNKPTVYIYLLQYFYYSEALEAEDAVYLYFYLALVKKKKGWSNNAIIDFLGSLIKDIIQVSVGGGLFVSGLSTALITLLTRYIKENTETDSLLCDPETMKYSKKEWDEVLSDYYKFKHCFLQYLLDLRYEIGPQKFEELYSKEVDEWVKGMK